MPAVVEPVVEPKEKAKPPTRAQKAQALYESAKKAKGRERVLLATELLSFKATAKVSWSSLGITEDQVTKLKTWAD
jgi:hypothetical protein